MTKAMSKLPIRIIFALITLAGVTSVSVAAPANKEDSAKPPAENKTARVLPQSEYRDVPLGHWAAASVDALSRLGIIQGHPDGTFRGDKPMTRYEYVWAESMFRLGHPIYPLPPSATEQALRTDVNQILDRLTALENRFKTLEDKLNAVPAPAGLSALPQTGATNEIQSLHNDFKNVATETGNLLSRVNIREVPETPNSK